MNCNTRQNTLDKLIELQIIDDNRNVLNEKLLSTKMDIYKNTAEKKYGVFSDTPIYTIEERKQERTEKYGKLPSKIWKKLVLNIPFFDRLDIAVKEYQQREEQARQRAIEANEYINEEGDVVSRDDLQYQKLTQEEKAKTIEQITKEHRSIAVLKDLAHKLAHRIGGTVRFENRTDVDWKGYNQGMTSVLNEAYMTPDTPFHEILAHPIIRAIKNKNVNTKLQIYEGSTFIQVREIDGKNWKSLGTFKTKEDAQTFIKNNSQSQLYQSLLKELETGRGKEVFEQVKRDYKHKYKILRSSKQREIVNKREDETDQQAIVRIFGGVDEALSGKNVEINGKLYNYTRLNGLQEQIEYTLEEQQEEAIVTLLGLMAADKLDAKKDATLISKLKELWKQISDFVKSLLTGNISKNEINNIIENEVTYTDENNNPCAKEGISTLFDKGGKWEIVTDFKNAPTHKSGGKDISIQGKKVEVEKNELRIENDFGDVAVIPSKYRIEVQDAIKSDCNSCIDGIVESLPKMKDYAGDGTVFPFFGRYRRFKNSLPDNLKNTPESEYAMRYYWKHNDKPKSFEESLKFEKPMFTLEDDGFYHAPSVEPHTLRFLKPKNHPTLQYELDWYNSDNPDAVDFRNKYDLDTRGRFYKYVPKKVN